MQISVIIPTYQEVGNISKLVPEVSRNLRDAGLEFEILVMDDDSPDGTADTANGMAGSYPVRAVNRKGRKRGLSESVIDGFNEACGEICVVMDADLSHPTDQVAALVNPILRRQADIVVGSRYIRGGGIANWPKYRLLISRVAAFFAYGLAPLTDPTSGFMAVRRDMIPFSDLDPIGWKIVLEVVAKLPEARIQELPIIFKDRFYGSSKMGWQTQFQYIEHLFRLYRFKFETVSEFLMFSLVGLSGIFVDQGIAAALILGLHWPAVFAGFIGFSAALSSNYVLNRRWSFNRLPQRSVASGYFWFWVICLTGLLLRTLLVVVLQTISTTAAAHPLKLNLLGIAVAAVVNFLGSRYLVFFKK